jgi:hypothetical protein
LAAHVRRTSGQERELVALYFAILRGEAIPVPGRPPHQWPHPKLEHRMAAVV